MKCKRSEEWGHQKNNQILVSLKQEMADKDTLSKRFKAKRNYTD